MYAPDVRPTDLWDVYSIIVINLFADYGWSKTKRRLNIKLINKFLDDVEALAAKNNDNRFVTIYMPNNGELPYIETIPLEERDSLWNP